MTQINVAAPDSIPIKWGVLWTRTIGSSHWISISPIVLTLSQTPLVLEMGIWLGSATSLSSLGSKHKTTFWNSDSSFGNSADRQILMFLKFSFRKGLISKKSRFSLRNSSIVCKIVCFLPSKNFSVSLKASPSHSIIFLCSNGEVVGKSKDKELAVWNCQQIAVIVWRKRLKIKLLCYILFVHQIFFNLTKTSFFLQFILHWMFWNICRRSLIINWEIPNIYFAHTYLIHSEDVNKIENYRKNAWLKKCKSKKIR